MNSSAFRVFIYGTSDVSKVKIAGAISLGWLTIISPRIRLSAVLHAFLFHTFSLFQRSFGTAWYCIVQPLALYEMLMFPLLANQKLHYFILCSVTLMIAKRLTSWRQLPRSFQVMFDMRSVFHRAKTLSTVVTKQVSYQIFICIFRLRVTSPCVGIRL